MEQCSLISKFSHARLAISQETADQFCCVEPCSFNLAMKENLIRTSDTTWASQDSLRVPGGFGHRTSVPRGQYQDVHNLGRLDHELLKGI